jgi:hypothetical protein
VLTLLACAGPLVVAPAEAPPSAGSEDTGGDGTRESTPPEALPGDSAPDASGDEDEGDDDPAARQLTAPGLVDIDCGGQVIPTEGKVDCSGSFSWEDGEETWHGTVALGLRGRSSASFPKQQYAVELRQDDGIDDEVDLYGLGADGDWVLNGMWIDRALFRNALAFEITRALGGWAPETAYVELTLDGTYRGLYLLTERVERGKARIEMPPIEEGGFVVKADEAGLASSVQYGSWNLVYPGDPTDADWDLAEERLEAWERGIRRGDGSAWEQANVESFARFVLVEELFKNNDAYYLSHHVHVGDDGLLHMIPWDLDLTLGQPSYNDNENPESWVLYRPDIVALSATTDTFREAFVAEWEAARARGGALEGDALVKRMEEIRAFLGPAIDRNWAAWDITTVDFWGYLYFVNSPDEEYERVAAWTRDRLDWMDAQVEHY